MVVKGMKKPHLLANIGMLAKPPVQTQLQGQKSASTDIANIVRGGGVAMLTEALLLLTYAVSPLRSSADIANIAYIIYDIADKAFVADTRP